MKKIILHWTAGLYYPNESEYRHYHYLIDKDGKVHDGEYKPEDNLNCYDGKYAAHTGGGNTAAIGVAMCAMFGYKSREFVGNYPITAVQFESCMKFCAELVKKYSININASEVMTHYEFGKKNPKTSSAGKIDITYIPPYSRVGKDDCGNFIRSKIRWYKEKMCEVQLWK